MKIPEKDLFITDDNGYDTSQFLAHVKPASAESVNTVLSASEAGSDGRSGWMWVRLQNGDLILGVYPQGDTYTETEHDHC